MSNPVFSLSCLFTFLFYFSGNSNSYADTTGTTSKSVSIRYLYNSGWLIETDKNVLLIDYVPAVNLDLDDYLFKTLADAKARGKQPSVFITHEHKDHFHPAVLDWNRKINHLNIVLGWDLATNDKTLHKVFGRDSLVLNGLKILSHPSTDAGSSFLIDLEGFSLYHAGDHALWVPEIKNAFLSELNFVAQKRHRIDIAFVPVARGKFVGCKSDDLMMEGALLTVGTLHPSIVFPMHMGCDDFSVYQKFSNEIKRQDPKTVTMIPGSFNQVFNIQIP